MPVEVEHRTAIIEPEMRCPRAGTRGGREIFRVVGTRRRTVGHADWRILVTIAELKPSSAEHAANAGHERLPDALTHLRARSTILLDCRQSIELSVLAIKFRGQLHISCTDRAAFGIIGGKQAFLAPALQHGRQLPTEIDRICNTGVHAQGTRRRELMRGVAREEDTAPTVALRND